jgi:hypothetical protein
MGGIAPVTPGMGATPAGVFGIDCGRREQSGKID